MASVLSFFCVDEVGRTQGIPTKRKPVGFFNSLISLFLLFKVIFFTAAIKNTMTLIEIVYENYNINDCLYFYVDSEPTCTWGNSIRGNIMSFSGLFLYES